MPIVTWNRQLPVSADWSYYNSISGSDTPLTGEEVYHVGSQTTTSFRTSPDTPELRGHRGFKRSSTDSFVRGRAQREADYNQLTGPEILAQLGAENRFNNGDVGNEFYTKKVEYIMPNRHVRVGYRPPGSGRDFITYVGPITSGASIVADSFLPSHDKIVLDGTACVRATIPTTQQAVLAQFLLELRERLPHLYGTTLLKRGVGARQIGDEYLNSKFGIDPLVSDVKKIGHSILNFNKLIKDFQKKSGTNVHRRHTLYSTSSQPYDTIEAFSAPVYMSRPNNSDLFAEMYDYRGLHTATFTSKQSCTFSGAYTYYLDQGHSYLAKMEYWAELADYLLGVNINADTIWELTPWSWLADWFSNTGTFLSNVTALNQDAQVMRYGYVMHSCETITSLNVFGMQPRHAPSGYYGPSSFTEQVVVTEKRRTRATPYGFGVDLGSLTPQRWAILAALGLTRAPNKLRVRS